MDSDRDPLRMKQEGAGGPRGSSMVLGGQRGQGAITDRPRYNGVTPMMRLGMKEGETACDPKTQAS